MLSYKCRTEDGMEAEKAAIIVGEHAFILKATAGFVEYHNEKEGKVDQPS